MVEGTHSTHSFGTPCSIIHFVLEAHKMQAVKGHRGLHQDSRKPLKHSMIVLGSLQAGI